MKSLILKFNSAVSLLETKEKTKLIYVFIIFIFTIIFDIIGIGLIVPILTIVLSGKINEDCDDRNRLCGACFGSVFFRFWP